MPGHQFPVINIHDHATVQLGDRITYVTNNGPLLLLDSQGLDIDSLQQKLILTSSDFGELKRLIEDGTVDTSSGPELLNEVQNVESMVETLKFHLEENDFRAGEGWQRPLQDVNRVVTQYRDSLRREKAKIDDYRAEVSASHGGLSPPLTELRELKLKLSVAISMLSYCSFQAAGFDQQQIQDLDVRLRQVLDELENEKATRIQPGQAWNTVTLSHVETDYEFVLHRHMQGSIEDDQTTIRAASMQVSTILQSPSILSNLSTNRAPSIVPTIFNSDQNAVIDFNHEISPGHAKVNIEQESNLPEVVSGTHPGPNMEEHATHNQYFTYCIPRAAEPAAQSLAAGDINHRWVTFSCITGRYPDFTEVLICRLLVDVNDTIQKIKSQLRTSYASILDQKDYFGVAAPLLFFYGCVYLSDYLRFGRICHGNLVPRIVCVLHDTQVDAKGNGPISLTLQTLRKFVRTGEEYAHRQTLSTGVGIIQLTFFGDVDFPATHERLVAELLALMVVGMQYDDENGKHAAIHAYSEAYRKIEILLQAMTERTLARRILRSTTRELARRIGLLEDAKCLMPALVHATGTCKTYGEDTALNVLAVSVVHAQVKVMPADESEDFLSHAWDTGNGWVKLSDVKIDSKSTIPMLSLPFETATGKIDHEMRSLDQSFAPFTAHYRSLSTKSDSAIPFIIGSAQTGEISLQEQRDIPPEAIVEKGKNPTLFTVACNQEFTSNQVHKDLPYHSFDKGKVFNITYEEGDLLLGYSHSGGSRTSLGWINRPMATKLDEGIDGISLVGIQRWLDVRGRPENASSARTNNAKTNQQPSHTVAPKEFHRLRSKSTSGLDIETLKIEVKRKPLPASFKMHAIRPGAPDEFVHGLGVTSLTKCEHWDSDLDVIAIKHKCCKKYCACIACHDILAGHKSQVWSKADRDTFAVLCGRCRHEMTIAKYLICNNQCPNCAAGFNPGCAKHYDMYFEM